MRGRVRVSERLARGDLKLFGVPISTESWDLAARCSNSSSPIGLPVDLFADCSEKLLGASHVRITLEQGKRLRVEGIR